MPICPDGHDSPADDYCEVCGLLIPPPTSSQRCPRCDEARAGAFCESCGYDFAARSPVPPGPSPVWTAVVTADRAYFDTMVGPEDGIRFPPYCPQRRLPLSGGEVRIGRRSTPKGAVPQTDLPEINLAWRPEDPGVSHLHAVLLAQPHGSWALVDLGSTNGTRLNGNPEPLEANTAVPLTDGDRIHLGAWTTITVYRT